CGAHRPAAPAAPAVPPLAGAAGSRRAWEAGNPLLLEDVSPGPARAVYRSARVGLSLKRSRKAPEPPRFVMRPYRFFTEPRRTAKGKPHMVLALYAQGQTPEAIQQLTGGTRQAIGRYIADFEEGRRLADFDSFYGIHLGPKDLFR